MKIFIALLFASCLSAATIPASRGPADPKELEWFVDHILRKHMEASHTPGAVFVLVRDGHTMFQKGYGVASIENKTPVVADRTLFRVASLSKLFTATAIMQLCERGKISLSEDINRYLNVFQLANNYPKPVTLSNILTHTAGFDGADLGGVAPSKAGVTPLGEHLALRMPPRVMPPGETWSYSNYGLALAGYVVETASGMEFSRYIDVNILQPLGMRRSSFGLPPELASDLATGYRYASGKYQPLPYYYMNVAPCGALVTTAADMAKFMLMHLQDGRYGDARILSKDTAREMHNTHFSPSPGFDGMAYGFIESRWNGRRWLEHTGGIPGFQSIVRLLPGENIGYFISATSNSEGGFFLTDLSRELEDHYWPARAFATPVSGYAHSDLSLYGGTYRPNVYSRTTSAKAQSLSMPVIQVMAMPDGTLSTSALFSHRAGSWVQVAPEVFQKTGGEQKMTFRHDGNRVSHLIMEPDAFEREQWYEKRSFHVAAIAVSMTLFVSVTLGWPIATLVWRLRGRRGIADSSTHKTAVLLGVICAFNVAYPLLLDGVVSRYESEFGAGVPPVYIAVRALAVLAALATISLPVAVVMVWRKNYWSRAGRWYFSVVAGAAIFWVPYLAYWNLLGFGV